MEGVVKYFLSIIYSLTARAPLKTKKGVLPVCLRDWKTVPDSAGIVFPSPDLCLSPGVLGEKGVGKAWGVF